MGDTGPFASRELSKAGLILLLLLPPWSRLRSSRVPRPCHQPLPTSKVLIAGRQEGSAGVRTDTKESGRFSLPAAWDEPSTSPPKPTESSAQAAGRYKGSERCRGGKCCATAGVQPSPELKLCRASTPKHSLRVLGGVINWGGSLTALRQKPRADVAEQGGSQPLPLPAEQQQHVLGSVSLTPGLSLSFSPQKRAP